MARCDLFWPGHEEATSNEQYLHLNDTLVAPIWIKPEFHEPISVDTAWSMARCLGWYSGKVPRQ